MPRGSRTTRPTGGGTGREERRGEHQAGTKERRGLIVVITGHGKGKTTTAFGRGIELQPGIDY